jgi:general secretion pathway protein M
MNDLIPRDRPTVVVAATLAALLLLVLHCLLQLWLLRLEYAREIDQIEPRTARLLGIVDSAEQLQVQDAAARVAMRKLAYPADRDRAATEAAMQQDIREVLAAAGLSIASSQSMSTGRAGGFDKLSLAVAAEGNINALEAALSSLALMRPTVFIQSLKLRPSKSRYRRSREAQREQQQSGDQRKLTAKFELFSLRLNN